MWPKEIQDLLILLKLVHPKASKNAMTVKAFNKAIDKLIIFRKVRIQIKNIMQTACVTTTFFQSDVPLDKLHEKSNRHPYIIAVGDSMENITRYYIDLERHLMPVGNENLSFFNTNSLKFFLLRFLWILG